MISRHKTTLRARRENFAQACLMAHQMRQQRRRGPSRPHSSNAGNTVKMSNRTYTVGPRGNFIRQQYHQR